MIGALKPARDIAEGGRHGERSFGGCIFHPVMFSPPSSFDGLVYTDGKMLPPLSEREWATETGSGSAREELMVPNGTC